MHFTDPEHLRVQGKCLFVHFRPGQTNQHHHQQSKKEGPSHIDQEGYLKTTFSIGKGCIEKGFITQQAHRITVEKDSEKKIYIVKAMIGFNPCRGLSYTSRWVLVPKPPEDYKIEFVKVIDKDRYELDWFGFTKGGVVCINMPL